MKLSQTRKKQLLALGVSVVTVGGFYAFDQINVQQKLQPTTVVVAKQDIPAHSKITEDMLTEITVPGQGIPPNAIQGSKKDIVGKWTVQEYSVPKNSFFFSDKVVNEDELPDAAILALEKGEVAFPLIVDIETSAGNSIVPDSYVDLYFKRTVRDQTTNEEKIVYGGMFEHVRVTAAKDSDTLDTFKNSSQYDEKKEDDSNEKPRVTKLYTFAVTPEQLQFLDRAKMLGQIVPVATGESLELEGKSTSFSGVSSQKSVLDYVNQQSQNPLPQNVLEAAMR